VTVQTVAGVVQLGGVQPTENAAAAVVAIVRKVDGVRDVQSNIVVDPAAGTPRNLSPTPRS
jgi:osmotically-inducible protein OsmY